ncbi:hypothetical protein HNY73_017087 [Argiope bruennichi]|uniref:Uncharacterized protein n=1 Tax=Argiope bruennichi TaxID=94029 RepID=A0A8T0EQR9_ARGBR|nr:hypothetical protein HNY73_017087 [Argiope bruennichi]
MTTLLRDQLGVWYHGRRGHVEISTRAYMELVCSQHIASRDCLLIAPGQDRSGKFFIPANRFIFEQDSYILRQFWNSKRRWIGD